MSALYKLMEILVGSEAFWIFVAFLLVVLPGWVSIALFSLLIDPWVRGKRK